MCARPQPLRDDGETVGRAPMTCPHAAELRRLHLIALAAENAETKRERRDRIDELVRAALEVKETEEPCQN